MIPLVNTDLLLKVPMRVFGLLTERGENTTVFTVFGTPIGSGSVDWVVVRIDLKTLFPRDCKEEDYRRWYSSIYCERLFCYV